MSSAAGNEAPLSKSTQERLERVALSVGMTGDELASTFVAAIADAIVKASRKAQPPPENVIPFQKKR
ncbi:hypothetical protein D3C81_1254550 [compost metagenome]